MATECLSLEKYLKENLNDYLETIDEDDVHKEFTHRNVTTTQIYADLVNAKKRETVNKITLK